MTQDEIIDMAIQAGASPDENKIWLMYAEELAAFAELVAAKATAVEREACAKLCEEFHFGQAPMMIQRAIRARGEA